jgi:hypothetical protein
VRIRIRFGSEPAIKKLLAGKYFFIEAVIKYWAREEEIECRLLMQVAGATRLFFI